MNEFENRNNDASADIPEQSAVNESNEPVVEDAPILPNETTAPEVIENDNVIPDTEPSVKSNDLNNGGSIYGQNIPAQNADYDSAPNNYNVPPVNETVPQAPPMQQQAYMHQTYIPNQPNYNQPPFATGPSVQQPPYMQNGIPYHVYTNVPKPFPENFGAANPVKYTPVENNESSAASQKGFKVFCVILVVVLALSAGCVGGYFLGRKEPSVQSLYSNKVDLDLAAKPKDTDESTAAEVYEAVDESIVGIRVYNSQGKMADASGVIYTKDGYVITNDHIYSEIGAPQFKIYMHDGTQYNADYVAGDVVSDLAVLKIRDGKNLKPATLGNSDEIYCGERVAAVGRPNDATARSTITTGIVSLTSRRVQTTSSYSARLIQTDSAINPGSSGGALVNMYGQVIGITASKLSGENYDRIGFAIPTTTVKRVVEQLIKSGEVTDRAKLGISYTMVDSVTAEISDVNGVGLYVSEVTEDSDLYGKIGKGDIITHVNGIAITDDDIILDIIEACRAGDSITVSVLTADGAQEEYKAELKANIGSSSYSENMISEDSEENNSNGGTFDFPFGE